MESIKGLAAMVVALAVVAGAPSGVAASDVSTEVTAADEAEEELTVYSVVGATLSAVSYGDTGWAREFLLEVLKEDAYAGWKPVDQYRVHYLLAQIEMAERNHKKAYAALMEAARIAPEARDGLYWRLLARVSMALEKPEEAVDAFTIYVEGRPNDLNEINGEYILNLLKLSGDFKDEKVRQRRLLEALRTADYRSEDPAFESETFWFTLFKLYADQGEDEKAMTLLPFTSPWRIQVTRMDRRYRRFVEARPDDFDYAVALENDLIRHTVLVGEKPNEMQAVYRLASSLYEAGKVTEAGEIIDTILEKVGEDAYTDETEYLPWVYNLQSDVFLSKGMEVEAVGAQIMARDIEQATTGTSVSMGLNLASLYDSLGKPDLALAEIKPVPKTVSSYGRMVRESIKACAYGQLGRKGQMKAALKHIAKNQKEGLGPTLRALECAGDEAVLAAAFIEALKHTDTRTAALAYAQINLPQPHQPVLTAEREAMRKRVLARPDVRTMIETYGVVETYPDF